MYGYSGPFAPGPVRPVAKVGENILLADHETYKLYEVAFIEPFAPSHTLVFNAGALAAAGVANNQSTTAILDNQYGQLSQIRARVLDDVHVLVKQPQAVARMSNLNVTARINAFSALYDPYDALSEFFIFENQRFFLDFLNPTQYAIAQSRVLFYGYKYVLLGREGTSSGNHLQALKEFLSIDEAMRQTDEIRGGRLQFTVIPTGGWGR